MNRIQKEIAVVGKALDNHLEMIKDLRAEGDDAEFRKMTEEIEMIESFMKRLAALHKLVD